MYVYALYYIISPNLMTFVAKVIVPDWSHKLT